MNLLLKVQKDKNIKYYKFNEQSNISLSKEERVDIEIVGDITFLYDKNKWLITNNTDKKIRYGHHHIKIKDTKILHHNKVIKYKKYKIIAIDYKDKKTEKISVGLKNTKETIDLSLKTEFLFGRSEDCDIVINNPQIDLVNTRIIHDGDIFYIEDVNSANGLIINNKKYKNKILEDYDTITIPGAIYMFINDTLLRSESNDGIRIDVNHIYKKVRDFETHKPINLINDVSLTINESEYVAIVGGSGAGKSTFLDCVNGRRPMTSGSVYYDRNNYYKYYEAYQKIVGYVPQSDIMHTDLSVYKTLYYYAQIRMHHHLNKQELNDLIKEVLDDVSLYDKKDVIVSSLSGGQKKRVSIAMELLANPKVIFLDEPTSGLSPDLDYDIMSLLKDLKDKGKTIVIITHNMENLDKCDKIAFLGKGGKLCYYGKPDDIFEYFGTRKYGEIFKILTEPSNVEYYQKKLLETPEYQEMLKTQDEIYGKSATK